MTTASLPKTHDFDRALWLRVATAAVGLPVVLLLLYGAPLMLVRISFVCLGLRTAYELARGAQADLLVVSYAALTWLALWLLYRQDVDLAVLVLVCAWASDTGAYFGGRTWGRTKMAPFVSPHKTWEGAVCGFVSSVAAGALFEAWREPFGSWPAAFAFMPLAAALAQVGDLFKSVFKRSAGVKDAGAVLPGHGGLLDRLDSVLLVAPALWLARAAFLV